MRKGTVPSVAVVDRDTTNCLLLQEICTAGAWSFAGCAHDITEGMALLARTRPNCLITDYRFDGPGTGLDLIVEAKRLIPNLFTVMLTGWDINDVAAHVISIQPDRILRKPVPPHVLMDLLGGLHERVEMIRINAV